MSNILAGSFSVGATGTFSISGLTALPTKVNLRASAIDANNESTQARFCDGVATDVFKSVDSILSNSNGFWSRRYRNSNARCLIMYATPAGTFSIVCEIKHISFDNNGGGDYGWTFEVLTYNGTYPFTVSAEFTD